MAASNHRGTGLTIGSNLGFEVFPKDTETGGMEVELLFFEDDAQHGTRGNSSSNRDVFFFLFKSSFIYLFGKRAHSGQILQFSIFCCLLLSPQRVVFFTLVNII